MKKYTLNNLDCADCALKIENGLSRLDSVESVSISFATASMHIETESMDEVVAAIRHIEPDVEVADVPSGSGEDETRPGILKGLLPIGISVVVFVLGMVFKGPLHDTAYSYGEYFVFVAAYLLSGWRVLATAGKNIIKGSNYIDVLSRVKTVVFDKTGTLTRGHFKVTGIVVKNGFSREETLKYAALAESHSNHPLAESIKEAYGRAIDAAAVEDYQEISGHGIRAVVLNTPVIVGNDRLLHLENIPHGNLRSAPDCCPRGRRFDVRRLYRGQR